MSRHLPDGPKAQIVRPVNYARILGVMTLLLGLVSVFTLALPYLLPLLQNRNLWAAISLISVLLFTSGHMFNHIRKVPYVTGDGKGSITYFAGGFSNQLGLESQIIAAICKLFKKEPRVNCTDNAQDGVLSFTVIALTLKTSRIIDTKAQQASVVIWSVILLVMYSFLMSIFRTKSGGYPFFLPPF